VAKHLCEDLEGARIIRLAEPERSLLEALERRCTIVVSSSL